MNHCLDVPKLHRRLRKINGQINAIDRMIEEDVPCEEILVQLNAAKAAIHKCGQMVLEGHIRRCIKDGLEHGDLDQVVEAYQKEMDRFSSMFK